MKINRSDLIVLFICLFLIFALVTDIGKLIIPFAVCSLPGILLSLMTLTPVIRTRAKNYSIERVILILMVMALSAIILFLTMTRLGVEICYLVAGASMGGTTPCDVLLFSPSKEEYDEKMSVIVYETWKRALLPPFLILRQQCYASNKEVCDIVNQLPTNEGPLSLDSYLRTLFLVLISSPHGGMFVWHFTRKNRSQKTIIEAHNEKE